MSDTELTAKDIPWLHWPRQSYETLLKEAAQDWAPHVYSDLAFEESSIREGVKQGPFDCLPYLEGNPFSENADFSSTQYYRISDKLHLAVLQIACGNMKVMHATLVSDDFVRAHEADFVDYTVEEILNFGDLCEEKKKRCKACRDVDLNVECGFLMIINNREELEAYLADVADYAKSPINLRQQSPFRDKYRPLKKEAGPIQAREILAP